MSHVCNCDACPYETMQLTQKEKIEIGLMNEIISKIDSKSTSKDVVKMLEVMIMSRGPL